MIVYVHSHDVYDSDTTFIRHRKLPDVEHIIIPYHASVDSIINSIIARARNKRSIWLLVLNAHGNSTFVSMGTNINQNNVHNFWKLAPYMTPSGRGVEIHSCLTASARMKKQVVKDGQGLKFLRTFASSIGTTVRAGYGSQVGWDSFLGIRHGDRQGMYETPWVSVRPSGEFKNYKATDKPWDDR
ncbi:hypothetical protein [Parasulfitobacter algicola]|uniref:DUF4347 domain-containing protein n=1 Tax=Parasulfitobacter algicola TaxID=2614809 RepID=A0ABX2IRU1_9RHOB|nr:hypothetical protein [Sulfitobacter algicola]NSX55619.1 hypothetical protein [Sulfitobacter algicola]